MAAREPMTLVTESEVWPHAVITALYCSDSQIHVWWDEHDLVGANAHGAPTPSPADAQPTSQEVAYDSRVTIDKICLAVVRTLVDIAQNSNAGFDERIRACQLLATAFTPPRYSWS